MRPLELYRTQYSLYSGNSGLSCVQATTVSVGEIFSLMCTGLSCVPISDIQQFLHFNLYGVGRLLKLF